MNMAKKQNSFSSTKRDRNGENVPAIAGVEINEIRMYSIEGKMYLPETDLPKLEYRLIVLAIENVSNFQMHNEPRLFQRIF